jgi:hypothetical protein
MFFYSFRLLTSVELEVFHEPLAEVAPAALREYRALGFEGHSTLKTILWTAILK